MADMPMEGGAPKPGMVDLSGLVLTPEQERLYLKLSAKAERIAEEYEHDPGDVGISQVVLDVFRAHLAYPKQKLVPYLRRSIRKYLSRAKVQPVPISQLGDDPGEFDAAQAVAVEGMSIHEAIDRLPDEEKAAVQAKLVDGKTYEEIKDETGLTTQQTRTRVRKAEAILRELVDPEDLAIRVAYHRFTAETEIQKPQ